MFTGIVEELGTLTGREDLAEAARLTVRGELVSPGTVAGDSIAVNGVCLTVVDVQSAAFTADVMAETLARSTLGALDTGDPVNLERAVTAQTRLGGHVVQGHVDGVATVLSRTPGSHWEVVRLALPVALARYVVSKGSITVDGVSLTVSALGPDWFEVSLIPTTLARTTLGSRAPGQPVNLEVDVIAKYVERLLDARAEAGPGGDR
ncbi:MAG: riboflavin synthase [Geodermatophilaceae bacterium]